MAHYEGDLRVPDGARFAIIASRWNPRISDALVAGARETFASHGVADDAGDVVRVPGAWEIPAVAARIAAGGASQPISDARVAGGREAWASHGVAGSAGAVWRVRGAWEIPAVARRLAAGGAHPAIVARGCVIGGDTRHFEHVADRCADG